MHVIITANYFPLLRKLSKIHSCTVIAHQKSMFEEHVVPTKLVTGNDISKCNENDCRKRSGVHVTVVNNYELVNCCQ